MDSEVKTTEIPFSQNKPLLHFSKGLYGFEKCTDFILFDSDSQPFMWLQSVSEKALAFLVVDPFLFFPDYELDVDEESIKEIGAKSASDVLVVSIVTLSKEKQLHITANLQGPLVINKRNKKGTQIVLQDSRWCTKHDLSCFADKRSPSC